MNNWNDARIMGHFKDKTDRVLKPEPQTPAFLGSTAGWVDRTYVVKVPVGASYLEIMPSLFQPASGTLDLARCDVYPATAEQWAASQPKKVPSTTVTPASGASLPPELHVAGNQLKNVGRQGSLKLQGLCLDSLEWSAGGERLDKSVPVAIEKWKANVIRLPVAENFWFGHGPWQNPKSDGLGYRKVIDGVIEAASSRGAYVAIDLHGFGFPTDETVEFWKDVATRYKNHPAVLF